MVLESLRQATAALHREVENQVDLVSTSLTLPRYLRILQVFHTVFSSAEQELDARCPTHFLQLWQGRFRAHRIVDDLTAFGCALDPRLDAVERRPRLGSDGEWLGALYVLEGSTLGGQAISRHLEKHFGWRDGRGYSFFLGHAEQTGAKWRAVCQALEEHLQMNNQIMNGAHLTFDQMNRCIRLAL